MNRFAVGCDPEGLLVNRHGKLIASVGLLGGTKDLPRKTAHGFIQEDNVLLEFNTLPAKTLEEFRANIRNVLMDIDEIIKPLDLTLNFKPSGVFDDDQLASLQAQVAGCDPDYDAWSIAENDPPMLDTTNLRSCGGHVHVSFDTANESPNERINLVRAMDLLLGIPSVLVDDDVDRRSLYGKAGAHRPKFVEAGDAYDGVEYRTLSNFWLTSNTYIDWVFNTVKYCVEEYRALQKHLVKDADQIVVAINESNKRLALSLCNKYNLEVPNA